jgi:hypothetical protein
MPRIWVLLRRPQFGGAKSCKRLRVSTSREVGFSGSWHRCGGQCHPPSSGDCDMAYVVKIRAAIGRLSALFAVAGLVLIPIVRPAMTMPPLMAMDTHASLGDPTAADAGAPNEMPCCPHKSSLPDCSKDCPLMALCVPAPLHFASQTGLIIPLAIVSIVFPGEPPGLVSVAYSPPRKPPKI